MGRMDVGGFSLSTAYAAWKEEKPERLLRPTTPTTTPPTGLLRETG